MRDKITLQVQWYEAGTKDRAQEESSCYCLSTYVGAKSIVWLRWLMLVYRLDKHEGTPSFGMGKISILAQKGVPEEMEGVEWE